MKVLIASVVAFLSTSAINADGASVTTDIDLRAAYCLALVDRQISDIEVKSSDPEYKKNMEVMAKSPEFSYIPAMISAKLSQYKERRQQLIAFQKSRAPVDQSITAPMKAVADTDFSSQNWAHVSSCEDLTWLQAR